MSLHYATHAINLFVILISPRVNTRIDWMIWSGLLSIWSAQAQITSLSFRKLIIWKKNKSRFNLYRICSVWGILAIIWILLASSFHSRLSAKVWIFNLKFRVDFGVFLFIEVYFLEHVYKKFIHKLFFVCKYIETIASFQWDLRNCLLS